jgi:anti-sigma factor RsiW
MNCKGWEERIALSASGDLDPAAQAEVRDHLAECAACRGFAGEIEDAMGLLRSAHEEPIAAGHYTAVRTRVLERLARERSPWRRWVWVVALAGAMTVAGVFLAPRKAERPKGPVAVSRQPEAPVVEARVPELAAPAEPRARKALPAPAPPRRGIEVAALAEPLVVKLITNDPDVVIYWIADRKGESR